MLLLENINQIICINFRTETHNIPACNGKVHKVQLLHVVKHNLHFP